MEKLDSKKYKYWNKYNQFLNFNVFGKKSKQQLHLLLDWNNMEKNATMCGLSVQGCNNKILHKAAAKALASQLNCAIG